MERSPASAARGAFFIKKDMARLALGAVGFFVGRVVLFGVNASPAVAYMAGFAGSGPRFFFVAALTLAGLATRLRGQDLVRYAFVTLALAAAHLVFCKKKYRPDIRTRGLCAGIAALASGAGFAALAGLGLYFYLMALLDGVLACCLTFILKKAPLGRNRLLGGRFAPEDAVAASLVGGLVVAGAAEIYVGWVSLRVFLSGFAILALAFAGGSAYGAAAGLLLGVGLNWMGFPEGAAALAAAGLCAGALRGRGKPAALAGFLLGGALTVFASKRAPPDMEWLLSNISAALLFLLAPIHPRLARPAGEAGAYVERVRGLTARRLMEFAQAFGNLGATLRGLTRPGGPEAEDAARLIDKLADKVCEDCGRRDFCWRHNFYDTYGAVFALLGLREQRGRLDAADVKFECLQTDGFVGTLNNLFELGVLERKWRGQLAETRELAAQQLAGVGGVINRLAGELTPGLEFHHGLEARAAEEFAQAGIPADILIYSDSQGRFAAEAQGREPCGALGEATACWRMAKILSQVIGRKMRPVRDCHRQGNRCGPEFCEEHRLRVLWGAAVAKKQGSQESGDSYSSLRLRNGRHLLALSDGMGSGDGARRESAAAVEMLENFLDAGFETGFVLQILNSALALKTGEDTFQTLDICLIDLISGNTEFIKLGAAAAFLRKGSEVQVIRSRSLPIGIVTAAEPETTVRKLAPGDRVLLVSDGVLEAGGGEEWLAGFLQNFTGRAPQALADQVLATALSAQGPSDDMTVLAAWVKG
jgi:stage II sporulation protein E